MTIIRYKNKRDFDVQFDNPYYIKEHCKNYRTFKDGQIKNPLYPILYGVGYMGIGKYGSGKGYRVTKGSSHNDIYQAWKGMLNRCYNMQFRNKNKSYLNVKCCEEWHNFQHFAEWFDKNNWTKKYNNIKPVVDKDLFCNNKNKIYNNENCCILDKTINAVLVGMKELKDDNIKFIKTKNLYAVQIINKKLNIYLTANTIDELKLKYKQYKLNYLRELANEYKNKYEDFPNYIYQALIHYNF